MRLAAVLLGWIVFVCIVSADLRQEMASSLRLGRTQVEGWELKCLIGKPEEPNYGYWTAGFHEGANFLKITRNHTNKAGVTNPLTMGYLRWNDILYQFNYGGDETKRTVGGGSISSNGYIEQSVLMAYEQCGLRYEDLVQSADSITGAGKQRTVTGQHEGHPYTIVVERFPFGWRVVEFNIEYLSGSFASRTRGRLEGWTDKAGVTLPQRGARHLEAVNPEFAGRGKRHPRVFECDFSTLKPSTKLTPLAVFRPGAFVVAGPYTLLQMTESGELVDGSGLLKKPFLPWNIAYVLSVAGLVFFSSLWFWQYKRRTAGSRR
ncbi:MAG: hypothetical protein QY327_00015 [Fimbriimonadaceae bacterium]|nr:MAG: hypothetical protein UZ18_ATM001002037 [Armatimonadetes bacterium OLB18]WKZ80286.1 MAG: hypothetical protein QY327_00015 [Fimbriimonadaceae bacterium]